jgi:hypothetical protein
MGLKLSLLLYTSALLEPDGSIKSADLPVSIGLLKNN